MFDGAFFVDGFADDVDDASKSAFADGNGDRCARVSDGHPTNETVGGVHRDGTDDVFAEVLGDFDDEVIGFVVDRRVGDGECRQEWG